MRGNRPSGIHLPFALFLEQLLSHFHNSFLEEMNISVIVRGCILSNEESNIRSINEFFLLFSVFQVSRNNSLVITDYREIGELTGQR